MARAPSTKATLLRADNATLVKGLIAFVAGLALSAYGPAGGAGPFVMGPGFVVALGAVVALYGFLELVVVLWTRRSLRLSRAEWSEWGPALDAERESIFGRIVEGERPVVIAEELEAAAGVPRDVTLRYIIFVGRHLQSLPRR